MPLDFRIITEKKTWENFIKTRKYQLFVQSWNYAEFNKKMGDTVFPVGIFDGTEMIGGCLVIKVSARRGTFLYCPYGPMLPWEKKAPLYQFIEYLKELGRKENAVFIRMSPFELDTKENRDLLAFLRFRRSPLHILAETTWMLDVTPSIDDVMKGMDKDHRNLIRRAEKDGVKIIKSVNPDDFRYFFPLYEETALRHSFVPFSKKYIEEEFQAFLTDNQTCIFLAQYQGNVIAASVMYFYGNMGVYRHSASSSDPKYRKIPASYLIQFEAIKEAKERGAAFYNFWGIAPPGSKKSHPFSGITSFKMGFGGKRYDLLPCHDLPLSSKYWINYAVETMRKWRRGF